MQKAVRNGGGPGPRRLPGEARELLVASARELFASNGYSGTSTRQIAEHAGVNESVLFRNFRTKANLFDVAVVDPVREFLALYIEKWGGQVEMAQPADLPTRQFMAGLYEVLREHRTLVMALASAHAFEGDAIDHEEGGPLADLLVGLEDFVSEAAVKNGFTWLTPSNIPLIIRFAIGLVLAVSVFDEWLFPPGDRRYNRDTLVEEMVQFVVHGLGHPREERAQKAGGQRRRRGA